MATVSSLEICSLADQRRCEKLATVFIGSEAPWWPFRRRLVLFVKNSFSLNPFPFPRVYSSMKTKSRLNRGCGIRPSAVLKLDSDRLDGRSSTFICVFPLSGLFCNLPFVSMRIICALLLFVVPVWAKLTPEQIEKLPAPAERQVNFTADI